MSATRQSDSGLANGAPWSDVVLERRFGVLARCVAAYLPLETVVQHAVVVAGVEGLTQLRQETAEELTSFLVSEALSSDKLEQQVVTRAVAKRPPEFI